MTDAAVAAQAVERETPPPFEPDPELIDHLEGNERAIKRYRQRAEQLRAEAKNVPEHSG